MRLADASHTSRPWRIHDLSGDFRLEDVWALPTPGGADDFPRLVHIITSLDPTNQGPWLVRALFTILEKLAEPLGLAGPAGGKNSKQPTLRNRLPVDLCNTPGPDFATLPFTPLYQLDNEWAAEIVNRTLHGVLHLGWVSNETGGYHGQMAVLVKRNGLLGTCYMAGIKPFRHLIVYPLMTQELARTWQTRAGRRE